MSGAQQSPERPYPHATELSQPFWDSTREGRFVLQRCSTCGGFVWLPKLACPVCRTETLVWTDASGEGELYSYVVVHRSLTPGLAGPYVVAVVTLAEGPRFFTTLVDIPHTDVRIGMPVRIRFSPLGDIQLPDFTPAASEPATTSARKA